MVYNNVTIPVADEDYQAQLRTAVAPVTRPPRKRTGQLLATILGAWTMVQYSTFGYVAGLTAVIQLLGILKYFLWLAVLSGVSTLLMRGKVVLLARAVFPTAPFFACGVLSGFNSYDVHTATSPLWLWGVGVLAATVFGLGCSGLRFRRTMFFFFLIVVIMSALFVMVRPDLSISADERGGAGAWMGLFPGKNLFGLICVYGLMFSLAADQLPLALKVAAICSCASVLVFSHSQGAVATAGAVWSVHLLVQFLQRSHLSPSMRVLGLIVGIVVAVAVLITGFTTISGLLGRDTTLTGRTEIWADWFRLALQHWLIGTGPGSFTSPSLVTAELTSAESHLGTIHTPHNMLIAVFGETGLLGLLTFLVPLIYFSIFLPFLHPSREANFTSLITFTMLIGGITETREVFGVSLNMFLVAASYANCLREEWVRRVPSEPNGLTGRAIALGT